MSSDPVENPLIPALLALLRANPDGISEYSLMKQLEGHSAFCALAEDWQLRLFQKHFMIMNGLYRLQSRLWAEEQVRLEISPLCICMQAEKEMAPPPEEAGLPGAADPLRAYYLDWQQLEQTTLADVKRLLSGFAVQMADPDARLEALKTLQLEPGASPQQIRHRYRQLVAQLHPDRGGDSAAFVRVRRAYELLGSGQ